MKKIYSIYNPALSIEVDNFKKKVETYLREEINRPAENHKFIDLNIKQRVYRDGRWDIRITIKHKFTQHVYGKTFFLHWDSYEIQYELDCILAVIFHWICKEELLREDYEEWINSRE